MIFEILCTYLLVINIIAFLIFGMDKLFAVYNRNRISEKTLISLCAAGGSLGGLFAMFMFRHKIRKPKFYIGVPAILVAQIFVIIGLLMLI